MRLGGWAWFCAERTRFFATCAGSFSAEKIESYSFICLEIKACQALSNSVSLWLFIHLDNVILLQILEIFENFSALTRPSNLCIGMPFGAH